jgi:hypothetical protein
VPGIRVSSWLVLVSLLGVLAGCAGSAGRLAAPLQDRDVPVELEHVPFFSQVTDQCGPAALATILGASGVIVSPEALRSRVYVPDREGSLQLELLAATRQHGRIPYEIDPTTTALTAELDAGRPVLVLQNLGATVAPLWHYAVVVGYLPGEQQFVLRSGDRQRFLLRAKPFARSWKRAGLWGIVALRPGELPASPEPERYLRAVAAVEATAGAVDIVPAYRAATQRWPEFSLAWLGLGNASYAAGALQGAAAAYRRVLDLNPADAIALNNLAQVYLDQGCRDAALAAIDAAISSVGETHPVRARLLATKGEVLQSGEGSRCR